MPPAVAAVAFVAVLLVASTFVVSRSPPVGAKLSAARPPQRESCFVQASQRFHLSKLEERR